MPPAFPKRPRFTLLTILALWAIFYASFTLMSPQLLDDADSVHAEVAREMLLRHDYVTLYANGIRYLEKAPLLYWSIAASFRLFGVSTAAARIPLALTMLALALLVEAFARRAFRSHRAGLYAALITLSSFGLFLYTRLTLPDAMVCLWLTLALYAFYQTEQPQTPVILSEAKNPRILFDAPPNFVDRKCCYLFATACALNVLTKGLIGLVFPIAVVLIYLLLTRGLRATATRIRQLHPISSLAVFLIIAAPWHILIALANPTQGHPAPITFLNHHWQVPLPTNGNVHGWLWFYFINEQLLRYLNLRVPRDYDTVPLYLFWGLCFVWLMPFSAFAFKAFSPITSICSQLIADFRRLVALGEDLTNIAHRAYMRARFRGLMVKFRNPLLFTIWTAVVLLFFSFSTRQEYYVLPALPPLAMLIASWLAEDGRVKWQPHTPKAMRFRRPNLRITATLLALGTLFAAASLYFLLHTRTPSPNTDLATLLQQNPADYALSLGHFLDLNAAALGLFRLPLATAAASLFLGPLASYILRKQAKPHAATLTLATGAFTFLLAAHLALQTFAPVLTSQQLAATIAPQLHSDDLIVIHQEYEYASTLGFYLHRPTYVVQNGRPGALDPIHILTDTNYRGTPDYGRSSNLWYGSFFPDAPAIFETTQTLAAKWASPQRIFLWQDLANQPSAIPTALSPIYVIAKSGGKEIVSNQPNP